MGSERSRRTFWMTIIGQHRPALDRAFSLSCENPISSPATSPLRTARWTSFSIVLRREVISQVNS